MELFLDIFWKILPIYFLIFLGFIAGKNFKVDAASIGTFLIYFFTPAVAFLGMTKLTFSAEIFWLPILFFGMQLLVFMLAKYWGTKNWKDGSQNIFSLCATAPNSGYFGIPICLALFGDAALPIVTLIILSTSLFENTIGVYFLNKGLGAHESSFQKLLKLPVLYAIFLGLLFNYFNISLSAPIENVFQMMKGAYSTLGMMVIGFGLSMIRIHDHFDKKFLFSALFFKFILFGLLGFAIVWVDKNFLHYFSDLAHKVIIIESIVPVAANVVAFSTHFKCHPEKTSLVVLISTILALFVVPIVAMNLT